MAQNPLNPDMDHRISDVCVCVWMWDTSLYPVSLLLALHCHSQTQPHKFRLHSLILSTLDLSSWDCTVWYCWPFLLQEAEWRAGSQNSHPGPGSGASYGELSVVSCSRKFIHYNQLIYVFILAVCVQNLVCFPPPPPAPAPLSSFSLLKCILIQKHGYNTFMQGLIDFCSCTVITLFEYQCLQCTFVLPLCQPLYFYNLWCIFAGGIDLYTCVSSCFCTCMHVCVCVCVYVCVCIYMYVCV